MIEVEVATTLINRLRTVTPAVYGPVPRQAYGLVGPVPAGAVRREDDLPIARQDEAMRVALMVTCINDALTRARARPS